MIYLKKFWDNPYMRKIIIGTGIFILVIIVLLFVASCSNKTKSYSYEELENLLVKKVKNKYEKSNNLPSLNNKLEISINELINDGVMKSINEYTNDGNSCSAKVTIYNNNGYYLYIPNINCATNYKTSTLYNKLIEDSLTTSGNGLYLVDNKYIFKGDNINNYVKLNNNLYQVIRINDNGTIRLIENKKKSMSSWDDRYNIDRNSTVGINNYFANNLSSRIKEAIENAYNNPNLYTDVDKSYFIPTEFCIGKRSINESDNSGNIECSAVAPAFPLGMLELYEYYNASLDTNCNSIESESCKNYNYFNNYNNSFWTMTADKDTTYKVYKISSGSVIISNALNQGNIKAVVNINGDLVISSGDGSLNNPYEIKSFTN